MHIGIKAEVCSVKYVFHLSTLFCYVHYVHAEPIVMLQRSILLTESVAILVWLSNISRLKDLKG